MKLKINCPENIRIIDSGVSDNNNLSAKIFRKDFRKSLKNIYIIPAI